MSNCQGCGSKHIDSGGNFFEWECGRILYCDGEQAGIHLCLTRQLEQAKEQLAKVKAELAYADEANRRQSQEWLDLYDRVADELTQARAEIERLETEAENFSLCAKQQTAMRDAEIERLKKIADACEWLYLGMTHYGEKIKQCPFCGYCPTTVLLVNPPLER